MAKTVVLLVLGVFTAWIVSTLYQDVCQNANLPFGNDTIQVTLGLSGVLAFVSAAAVPLWVWVTRVQLGGKASVARGIATGQGGDKQAGCGDLVESGRDFGHLVEARLAGIVTFLALAAGFAVVVGRLFAGYVIPDVMKVSLPWGYAITLALDGCSLDKARIVLGSVFVGSLVAILFLAIIKLGTARNLGLKR